MDFYFLWSSIVFNINFFLSVLFSLVFTLLIFLTLEFCFFIFLLVKSIFSFKIYDIVGDVFFKINI